MQVIWGYSPEEILDFYKEVGNEIVAVKQLFSALLFKNGIKGICAKIATSESNSLIQIELHIDSEKVFEEVISPNEKQEYFFELDEVIVPEIKIEVILQVKNGSVQLPLSSIGTGMGFQKTTGDYQPTNHLALGLIIPDS
ncbi:MAG: hypothetical protein GOP50_06315 [Candidatus Heimdallarchaeota archaeon]|nr:hypothetical protein [Candidatus Heimdallarchaeota archaeon]